MAISLVYLFYFVARYPVSKKRLYPPIRMCVPSRRWICRRRGVSRELVRTQMRSAGPIVHRAPSSRPVARIDIDGSAGRLPVESRGPPRPCSILSRARQLSARSARPRRLRTPRRGVRRTSSGRWSSGKLLWTTRDGHLVQPPRGRTPTAFCIVLILGAVIFVPGSRRTTPPTRCVDTKRATSKKDPSFPRRTRRALGPRRVATRRRLERVRTRAPVAMPASRANRPGTRLAPPAASAPTPRGRCARCFSTSTESAPFFHLFCQGWPLGSSPPPFPARGRGDRGGAVVYGQHPPVPPD